MASKAASSAAAAAAGWSKVAKGAQLVASSLAKQTSQDINVAAQRASWHGLELSSRARQSLSDVINSGDLFQQNGWPTSTTATTTSGMDSTTTPNESPNSPYESQLRKKHLREQQQQQEQYREEQSTTAAPLNDPEISREVSNTSSVDINPYLLHAKKTANVPPPSFSSSPLPSPSGSKEDPFEESMNASQGQILSDESSEKMSATSAATANIGADEGGSNSSRLKEGQKVPSTRVERAMGFASLGIGLAIGTAAEAISRGMGMSSSSSSSAITTDQNADRLAATLCRMRGAALKMGQMLSIQDESLLPPALTRALNQVRQGADAMPQYQLEQQMKSELGENWRDKFVSFDMHPFAAASIGQVHKATILADDDGSDTNEKRIRNVVVKVQYPGVANSIESDLRNLTMLVTMTGLAPKGLFIENVIRVGRDELKVECNYLNEMANQQAFQELVANDPILQQNKFVVPNVIEELTTEQIITTDFAPGGTIDKVSFLNQEERNRIGRTILYLTMRELFDWKLMQTDPNWGNFLYDVGSEQTSLIDFGATREYSKEFVDGYLRIVWASANRDETTLFEQSTRMGFLTGEENDIMLRAHKLSGFTVGEPFYHDSDEFNTEKKKFDFRASQISTRMGEHTSVFLRHRLTPPPEEVYTLHRKLAGAYMLCIKLGAIIHCRDMLEDVVRNHTFEDGLPHPMEQNRSNEANA